MSKDDYNFYKSIGYCTRCHKEKAEPGKTLCLACKMYKRDFKKKYNPEKQKKIDAEKRAYRKEHGLCVNCGVREQQHGLLCGRCYSTVCIRRERNKSDISRSERAQYGICYICGKNHILPGKKVCAGCYETRLKSISKIMYMTNKEKNTEKFNLVM